MPIFIVVLCSCLGLLALIILVMLYRSLRQIPKSLYPHKPFNSIHGRAVIPPKPLSYHDKVMAELRARRKLAHQLQKSKARSNQKHVV